MINFPYYTGTFLVGAQRFGVPYPKLQISSEIFWVLHYLGSTKSKFSFLQAIQSSHNTSYFRKFSCKMLISFFRSNILLHIEKNPVEKLCKVLEMELKTYIPVDLQFVFEKIKFKVLNSTWFYSSSPRAQQRSD